MGMDVGRWYKYAKAKLESTLGQGDREFDRLEAEREAETADRPWLRSQSEAPSFDEAKARIEWEASHGHQPTEGRAEPPADADLEAPDAPSEPSGEVRSPADQQANAEAATAKLELEANQRASADRLEAIRRELGIDEPDPG